MSPPGPHQKLSGVLLHLRNFGDSHRIVEIFTESEGRVDLLARGARASKRRFAGVLDLFVSLEVQVGTRGRLWSLESADLFRARLGIRQSLDRLERANLLCESVRVIAPAHQPIPAAHEALVWGLDALDRGEVMEAAAAYARLLVAAGISPDIRSCSTCGVEAPKEIAVAADGALCGDCAAGRPLIRAELLEPSKRVLPSSSQEADALETNVLDRIEEHIGRALRSRAPVAEMRRSKGSTLRS